MSKREFKRVPGKKYTVFNTSKTMLKWSVHCGVSYSKFYSTFKKFADSGMGDREAVRSAVVKFIGSPVPQLLV